MSRASDLLKLFEAQPPMLYDTDLDKIRDTEWYVTHSPVDAEGIAWGGFDTKEEATAFMKTKTKPNFLPHDLDVMMGKAARQELMRARRSLNDREDRANRDWN